MTVMFRSWPNNLSGPLVVVEKSAQSLVPAHPASPVCYRRARNQDVPETLMIPLAVVMLDEFGDRAPKMSLPDRY
jgi:hypothetical protein